MAATRPPIRELAAAATPIAIASAIASRGTRRVARRTMVPITCSSGDTGVPPVRRGPVLGAPDPGLECQQREHEDPEPAPIITLHTIDAWRADGQRRTAPGAQLRLRN